MTKLTHALFYKGLMKIFAPFGHRKTNPKRTQTKPNSKMTKINASSVLAKDYEKKMVFCRQKNEAKTNPNSKNTKMTISLSFTKDYENVPRFSPKKTKPKRSQNEPNRRMVVQKEKAAALARAAAKEKIFENPYIYNIPAYPSEAK
jgi:hypothetical protein